MKVKTILVSQPEPKTETSPYSDLSDKQVGKRYPEINININSSLI